MKVFLDTNIIMDFCARRLPFFENASLIIDMGYRKELVLVVSSLTFINVAYILRKAYPQDLVMQKLANLAKICTVSPIDEEVILTGIRMKAKDFENSVQYLSALRCGAEVIITRDAEGFKEFPIPSQTPDEFLKLIDCRCSISYDFVLHLQRYEKKP